MLSFEYYYFEIFLHLIFMKKMNPVKLKNSLELLKD